jgi:putative hydrolase of the HAD superfamily
MLRHVMQNLRVIAFDADDTLWHNEVIFERVHERYRDLLSNYHDAETVNLTLFATEMRNLELYGYGVKGFTLSAIETAIELTAGKISAEEIRTLLERGRAMLNHPVELLDQVADTLNELTDKYDLWLITKGDLYFRAVEIVSEKNTATYATILQLRHTAPAEFLMVGNSLHSDILPVLELGASAAHVPYHLTWEHERSEILPDAPGRFFELAHLRELPALLLNPSSA